MFNYPLKVKIKQINKAISDFGELYNEKISPFTRKKIFYFFKHNNIKFIHKNSLRKYYTNLDTYSYDIETKNYCNLNDKNNIKEMEDNFNNVMQYIKSGPELLPQYKETENFLYTEYIDGEVLSSITKEDFYYLKEMINEFTPFYNSMAYNLIKKDNKIYLIDIKHLEKVDNKPFFIYMYNKDHGINNLYVDSKYDEIIEFLSSDYPMDDCRIIKYK